MYKTINKIAGASLTKRHLGLLLSQQRVFSEDPSRRHSLSLARYSKAALLELLPRPEVLGSGSLWLQAPASPVIQVHSEDPVGPWPQLSFYLTYATTGLTLDPGKLEGIEELLRKFLLGEELVNTQFHLFSARSSASGRVTKPRVICANNDLLAKSSKYFLHRECFFY